MATAVPWTAKGGVTDFSRGEARAFARRILRSETYRQWLEDRVLSRTLDPRIERMLWEYAYGKPVTEVSLTDGSAEALASVDTATLRQQILDLLAQVAV